MPNPEFYQILDMFNDDQIINVHVKIQGMELQFLKRCSAFYREEYIEHDGVITNEKNEVIHRFDVGVVRKTPPDAEKPSEVVCYCDIDDAINHVRAMTKAHGNYKVWVEGEYWDEFEV